MRAADVYRAQASSQEHGEHWSGPPQMVERLASLLGTTRTDLVVDVGSGVGGPARRLARLVGCRVVSVDLLESVLTAAVRRSAEDRAAPGAVRFLAGSAERLPLASERFDQAWSLGVMAHLDSVERFGAEVARVLRPGAAAAVTEVFWDGHRRPRFVATAPTPWRPVRTEEVVTALSRAGLEDVRTLPWPGRDFQSDEDVRDPLLRRDLIDGRLASGLVVGRRP